ncbi:MAG: copper amine oxidase N-terminal domain-containing protein, partial [Oscillospiraceae bacterium]
MKHIKRILCFSLIFALITCVFSTFSIAVNADEYTDRPMSVYIDKKPIVFDKGQTPIIVNDRTLVPLRAISEALDATVYWFQEDKRIQIVKYDKTLTMTIDVPTMSIYSIVSGEATFVTDTALDSPPILTGEDRGYRTYVPLRVIAEAFGAVVSSE